MSTASVTHCDPCSLTLQSNAVVICSEILITKTKTKKIDFSFTETKTNTNTAKILKTKTV